MLQPDRRGSLPRIDADYVTQRGVGGQQVVTGASHAVAERQFWQIANRLDCAFIYVHKPPVVLTHGARQNIGSGTVGDNAGDMVGQASEHLVATVRLYQIDTVVRGDSDKPTPIRSRSQILQERARLPLSDGFGSHQARYARLVRRPSSVE